MEYAKVRDIIYRTVVIIGVVASKCPLLSAFELTLRIFCHNFTYLKLASSLQLITVIYKDLVRRKQNVNV